MWLILGIRVVLRILGQALRNDVLLHGHLVFVHLFGLVAQKLVHPVNRLFLVGVPVQDAIQDCLTQLLGQFAPVAPHNVQTFELCLKRGLLTPADNLERGILLLLEQHQTGKHSVDLNLKPLVSLVHGALDLFPDLHGLLIVLCLRIHEDGVRVSIHHIQLQLLLHNRDRRLQGLSAFGRDQRCQRLCVEPAVLEAQAAVHGVGGELQRLLPNLQDLQNPRILLGLDGCLDLAPAIHQAPQHLRQDALFRHGVGRVGLRQKLGLVGRFSNLVLVGPIHRGEANVVLLDDGRVQTVEI
mmetsp:Transcript_3404/g.8032  ORF Transcript_3404/g.8032 Transcript_3404/m.8032 type:complete len:297 (-) Transcript_3404:2441-3331(-)